MCTGNLFYLGEVWFKSKPSFPNFRRRSSGYSIHVSCREQNGWNSILRIKIQEKKKTDAFMNWIKSIRLLFRIPHIQRSCVYYGQLISGCWIQHSYSKQNLINKTLTNYHRTIIKPKTIFKQPFIKNTTSSYTIEKFNCQHKSEIISKKFRHFIKWDIGKYDY